MRCWTPLLVFATLFVSPALAQSDFHACEASADLDREFRDQIRGRTDWEAILRRKLAADPDNFFLNRWYLERFENSPGPPIPEYKTKLDAHPEEALYLYYYGRALMGARTPEAIVYLNRAIAKDPAIPSAYWALLGIYSSRNFVDPAKLTGAMLHYTALCRDDYAGYNQLASVTDIEALKVLAPRLRGAIERRSTSGVASQYPRLWAAEAKLAGPDSAGKMKSQVAADLPRVLELNSESYQTLADAYRWMGDAEKSAEMKKRIPPPKNPNVYGVVSDWLNGHPFPSTKTSPEDKARWESDAMSASAAWIRDFPEETHAWYWRFNLVSMRSGSTDEEVSKVGDQTVAVERARPASWSQSPNALAVAKEWSKRRIRMADCLTLAAESIALIKRVPERENDLFRTDQTERRIKEGTIRPLFDAYDIEVSAAISLKSYAQAAAAIADMRDWIAHHSTGDARPAASLALAQARLADAQGHTMDAMAFYQRSIQAGTVDRDTLRRAQELWTQQGGSEEAFAVWLKGNRNSSEERTWSALATDWVDADKSLDAMRASDQSGRLWTIADLKGKLTFIAIWATWCGPCVDELPHVQKLFDSLKTHTDIQLLTLSIDEEAAKVTEFLRSHSYTFPVVLAHDLVHEILPEVSIPRSWIAGPTGRVRMESMGFDPRVVLWEKDMLERLGKLADRERPR